MSSLPQRVTVVYDEACVAPFIRLRHSRYPPGYLVVMHTHEAPQLLLVNAGALAIDAGGRPITAPAGAVVWIPERTPHRFRIVGRSWLDLVDICVAPDGGLPVATAHLRVAASNVAMGNHAARVWKLAQARDPWSHLILDGLLRELYGIAGAALASRQALPPPSRSDALLSSLFHCIGERHGEQLTLAELAHACGCSRQHLCRAAMRGVGRSPMMLLVDARIATACDRLAQGSSVRESAMQAGFGDLRHFNRVFRQRFGRSPANWRTVVGECPSHNHRTITPPDANRRP
jgi:AraC-like DNA-binding protein